MHVIMEFLVEEYFYNIINIYYYIFIKVLCVTFYNEYA